MKPTFRRPQVVTDFRGIDYVCEKTHYGNTTIKRNFEVWRG